MKIAIIIPDRKEIGKKYPQDWIGRTEYEDVDAVEKSLNELGHQVTKHYADLELFKKLEKEKSNIDLVFNLCDDGFFSNAQLEPHLPAILETFEIPYTGSGYLCLALCLNKARTKEILLANKIPTPKFQLFHSEKEKINSKLKFPLIVKPAHEDASIGIQYDSVVNDEKILRKKINRIIKQYKQPAIVEEFIDGREFNVGVVGDKEREVLPIVEIRFDGLPKDKPKIINYEAKWDEHSVYYKATKKLCPKNLDPVLKKKMVDRALKTSELMLCRDYCRVDFRVNKKNNPYVLEINPNPDIANDSSSVMMAQAKNYSYTELINKIIQSALQRCNVNKINKR